MAPVTVGFHFSPDADDDPQFISLVERLILAQSRRSGKCRAIITKIDNWFDWKWLHFSGKALGAFGVWMSEDKLIVPPFVPNRIAGQVFVENRDGRFVEIAHGEKIRLHIEIGSEKARRRRMDRVAPEWSCFWWSGRSSVNGRGSLLSYVWLGNAYHTCYIGFEKRDEWTPVEADGITGSEVRRLAADDCLPSGTATAPDAGEVRDE